MPRPLATGEQVELWLDSSPGGDGPCDTDEGRRNDEGEWDARPARVAAIAGGVIAVFSGGWGLSGAATTPGSRARVRRAGPEGIAEWEGYLCGPPPPTPALPVRTPRRARGEPAGAPVPHLPAAWAAVPAARETAVLVCVPPTAAAGRLYQRRRSPRVPLRLTPIRLAPLPPAGSRDAAGPVGAARPAASGQAGEIEALSGDDHFLLPVARLTDVSVHGAGVVVDCPLAGGTTVALEFELPGESVPFAVRGRVIEPAVPLHGEAQPQLDGLPGFRRGIEFLGQAASREYCRLATALYR